MKIKGIRIYKRILKQVLYLLLLFSYNPSFNYYCSLCCNSVVTDDFFDQVVVALLLQVVLQSVAHICVRLSFLSVLSLSSSPLSFTLSSAYDRLPTPLLHKQCCHDRTIVPLIYFLLLLLSLLLSLSLSSFLLALGSYRYSKLTDNNRKNDLFSFFTTHNCLFRTTVVAVVECIYYYHIAFRFNLY